MKVKIEFTNGNIEVTEADVVTIHREKGKVFARRANSRYDFGFPESSILSPLNNLDYELEKISRVTVDNEIIYDFMGRKERYKNEEALENIKKYCFGIE